MSYISVKGLTKEYGDVKAVDSISFEAEEGEFIALLGPSGCGKSTTLMMLAGLEEPTSGAITFNGKDVTREPPGKRGLSMVFQSYALFPHLN
ncbi:MAG: ATP-binding cassette domain-containing protein, partial [Sneathiellales bacterium]|nr:ATP-binding cassette domain-containing protein [Sneathiellales bacterium]